MPGICRNIDTAGGTLVESQNTVFVNGKEVIVDNDTVTPHGDSPHSNAKMISGSSTVFVGGIAICRAGDTATCGHEATGSDNVHAG